MPYLSEDLFELYQLLFELKSVWDEAGVNGCDGAYSANLDERIEKALESRPVLYAETKKKFRHEPWRCEPWIGSTTWPTGGSRSRSRSGSSSGGKRRTKPRPSMKKRKNSKR